LLIAATMRMSTPARPVRWRVEYRPTAKSDTRPDKAKSSAVGSNSPLAVTVANSARLR